MSNVSSIKCKYKVTLVVELGSGTMCEGQENKQILL